MSGSVKSYRTKFAASQVLAGLFVAISLLFMSSHARAAVTITVNSTADTSTPADGECTLREAITNANSNSDATSGDCAAGVDSDDLIHFSISGSGVHTIAPLTALPIVSEKVVIDGTSQTGYVANTAVSPAPFNGELVVEINGSALPNGQFTRVPCFELNDTTGVEIKGLVINRCGGDGILMRRANYTAITGNYIGTNAAGLVDLGNGRDNVAQCVGSGVASEGSNHAVIGGTLAAQRNIIAGNQCDELFIHNEGNDANPSGDHIVQGNYIGLGADGLTALPAGYALGIGNAVLFGNSHNDVIGGSASGEMNVVGSSLEFGLSFRDGCSGTIIKGNYVGTDYTGNGLLTHAYGTGNVNTGIHVFGLLSVPGFTVSHNFTIGGSAPGEGNIVSGNRNGIGGWQADGISFEEGSYGNKVQGNSIGVGADGVTALGNQGEGVHILSDGSANNLIGGAQPGEGNLIANNSGQGVLISDDASAQSVIGNTIHSNGGLGIELVPLESSGVDGVTANDALDADVGPNNLLNYPSYTDYQEASGDTSVDFVLDVPVGDYRIEFYSNSVADASGNGEGQDYLGFTNVTSSGSGVQAHSYTLSGVTGVTNLSLTATEVGESFLYGYGDTSEFGGLLPPTTDVVVTKTLLNPGALAAGGQVQYQISVTNNGPDDVVLAEFDGTNPNPFFGSLIIDFLPPELTYVSGSNPDVSCADQGNLGA